MAWGSVMVTSPPLRALMGFFAAALAVLLFHQGMVAALRLLVLPGLQLDRAPYDLAPVPPFGIPAVLDLAFWGGVYGIVFGLAAPYLMRPLLIPGLLLGVIATVIGAFVVAPLKGLPSGAFWLTDAWARALLLNGFWGIGLGIIYSLIEPDLVGAGEIRRREPGRNAGRRPRR